MSLAASSGGAGMGGGGAALSAAAMAHGGPSGMALHKAAAAQPPPGSHAHHFAGQGVSAPGNVAALGADLVDKSQRGLGLRSVRNAASMPIVAVDLYGEEGEVAYFPPVPRRQGDDDDGGGGGGGDGGGDGEEGPLEVHAMGTIGSSRTDVVLKVDDDAAHRAVRKLLAKGVGYDRVMSDALEDDPQQKAGAARIHKPHLLLGARRTSAVHPSALGRYAVAPDETPDAIAEDDARDASRPVSVRNGALDGSSGSPRGDDYDRVTFHLSLHASKKSLTMLPEEAVGIVLARARKLVDRSWSSENRSSSLLSSSSSSGKSGRSGGKGDDDDDDDDGEAYIELPAAVAVPGWANSDATCEALLEAAGGGGGDAAAPAALYQRSVAAIAGAFLPNNSALSSLSSSSSSPSSSSGGGGSNPQHRLLQVLGKRIGDERKVRQKREATGADDGPTGEYNPTLVLAGMTSDGIELSTIQLGRMQDMAEVDGLAPFGDITVHSSVCYQSPDPLSLVKRSMKELVEQTDALLPELFDEDGGPVAIVTYGTIPHQLKLKDAIVSVLKSYKAKGVADGWDDSIPLLSTREECVACGTALLAAVSHGRVYTIESGDDGGKGSKKKKKHRARPGVISHGASCSAVGVQRNYFAGAEDRWMPVKTVFDFDRRVPAGPYEIELSAAEAAAIRAAGVEMDEERLLEETKKLGGAKNIPKREEAALAMRLRVVQRTERGGKWIPVGDVMKPLTMMKGADDEDGDGDGDGDGDTSKKGKKKEAVACESSVLELSLNPVGMITSSLTSDGQSVVQATKSARNSALRYYLGIAAAILFFGGFLVKSYLEEHIFERDTQRLLVYYKHAAPNSLHDGDVQGARYLVWKYRGRKDKLWRRLEAKYGVPVKQVHEWDDEDDDKKEHDDEHDEQDLDEEDTKRHEKKGNGGEAEPDL